MNPETGREFSFPNSQDDGYGYPDPVTGHVHGYVYLQRAPRPVEDKKEDPAPCFLFREQFGARMWIVPEEDLPRLLEPYKVKEGETVDLGKYEGRVVEFDRE